MQMQHKYDDEMRTQMSRAKMNDKNSKICTCCGTRKLHVEFYRDKSQRDSFATWCKQCESNYNKTYNETLRAMNVTRARDLDEKSRAKFNAKMRAHRVARGTHTNRVNANANATTKTTTKNANAKTSTTRAKSRKFANAKTTTNDA